MDSLYSKHIVALDPLDYNLLKLSRNRHYSNSTPLWSVSEWGRNEEYFEFEIRQREKINRDDALFTEKSVTCHICDIDVPKCFIKEHKNSRKHAIYKRITDTALSRIQKHMSHFDENELPHADDGKYFCPECVAVVEIDNKDDHNRSQAHKQSKALESVLLKFVSIYTNDNCEFYSDTSTTDELNDATVLDHNTAFVDTNKEFKEDKTGIGSDETKMEGDFESVLNVLQDKLIDSKTRRRTRTRPKKGNKVSVNTLGVLIDSVLNIEAIDLELNKEMNHLEVKEGIQTNTALSEVDESYFNIEMSNGDGSVANTQCMKTIRHNDNDTMEVCSEIKKEPSNDSPNDDCKLNNDKMDDNANMLCKEIVEEPRDLAHETETVFEDAIYNVDRLNSMDICEDFKISHLNGTEIYEKHNEILKSKGGTHKIRIVSERYIEIETLDCSRVCVPGRNYFVYTKLVDGIRRFCDFCQEVVLSDKIEEHLKSSTHLNHLTKPLVTKDCIWKINNEKFYCVICYLTFDEFNDHLKSKYHQCNLKRALIKKGDEAISDGEANETKAVDTCKIIFYDDVNTTIYAKTLDEYGDEVIDDETFLQSEMMVVVGDDLFNCLVCSVNVHANDIIAHASGKRHRSNRISSVHYMLDIESDLAQCKVCKEQFQNDKSTITEHFNSRRHVTAYENHLYDNWIEMDMFQFYCRVCDERFGDRVELHHICSKKHIANRKSADLNVKLDDERLHYCRICDEYTQEKSHMDTHKNSETHKAKLAAVCDVKTDDDDVECDDCDQEIAGPSKQPSNRTELDVNVVADDKVKAVPYYCQVCDVNVPNNDRNIQSHVQGAAHGKKLAKRAMAVSGFQKIVSEFSQHYCDVCEVNVDNTAKNVKEHLTSAMHKRKLKEFKAVKMYGVIKCKVCKVDVPNSEKHIAEHSVDAVHQAEYGNVMVMNKLYAKDGKYNCLPCQGVVTEQPLKHIETQSHRAKLKNLDERLKVLDDNFKSSKGLIRKYDALDLSNVPVDKDVPFVTVVSETSVVCGICSTTVPRNQYNLTTHLNGSKHRAKYDLMKTCVREWQKCRVNFNKPELLEQTLVQLLERITIL